MVGIVVVSHSARLAEGVAELAREVGGRDVALALAGGLDLPGRPLGTDAALVLQAIESVYSDEGVLVLVDLGSAILSAELALDLLPAERRAHVLLSDAPLVEGAVAAAVQARVGAPLASVAAEARAALSAKTGHLAGSAGTYAGPAASVGADPGAMRLERRFIVRQAAGLHARPAAAFVRTASSFPDVRIEVGNLTRARGPVDARSLTKVLTLDVRQGEEILVTASGPRAVAALDALESCLAA